MSKHRRKIPLLRDIMPPLSLALYRLEESKQRGEESSSCKADVERLSQNPAHVALARAFDEKLERLALEIKLKMQRADSALAALARTDLTDHDVRELIKALRASEEIGLMMAQLQVDREEDLRWHPGGAGI